ncbi:MAG: hypothetical protein M3R13_06080 [Armatimonadota bacterium]|nr:hypothetical protein [Armatimonadota bacterium]
MMLTAPSANLENNAATFGDVAGSGSIIFTAALPVAAQPGGGGQGGGGGGTGGGTIYFINGTGGGYNSNYMWSMTSSGTNVTQLQNWGYFNVPSRALHNGHRWYVTTLSIPGEFYGDGVTQRFEVFALRGDYDNTFNNNTETRVQLTNDPTLQPFFGWYGSMHWLPGDGKISFRATRWSGSVRVEGGLYTADLVYRADGNVLGLAAQPGAPALAFALDANGVPAVGRHSWGLSTTQVAYIDSPETGLWIANLSTGTRTRIYTGGVGYVDWSQDGTKILFGSGTIRTVEPNGTTLKTVIGPRYVNNVWVSGFGHAYFSPTASHITCVGIMNIAGGGQDNDVIRATSTGGSVTNLTNTPSLVELPVSWR